MTGAWASAAVVRLPPLPTLTRLQMDTTLPAASLQLGLEGLPRLRSLSVEDWSDVRLGGRGAAGELMRLRLSGERASIAFALLPALQEADMWCSALEGAASVASATVLTLLKAGAALDAGCAGQRAALAASPGAA